MWAYNYELYHHGIIGQKWGERNGPPYPLGGGQFSANEKKEIYKKRRLNPHGRYNKRHFDKVLKKGTIIQTLSYDKNRTKNVDMFFGAYEPLDKKQYEALFNSKIDEVLYDSKTKQKIKTSVLKYRINNKVLKDIKIASEDSGVEAFSKLYKTDRDFYNYVKTPSRMLSNIDKKVYKFISYREAKKSLDKVINNKPVTSKDIRKIYRLFNYQIPSAGNDVRASKDVLTQRTKFFNALKQNGYSAVLDTNDTMYGGYKTKASVIVFDMESVLLKRGTKRVTMKEKRYSQLAYIGGKYLHINDGEYYN